MSEQKAFELRVIFSVLDKTTVSGTTAAEKLEFISFVTDSEVELIDLFKSCTHTDKYLSKLVKDRAEIGQIIQNTIPDTASYKKICDIFWYKQTFKRGCIKPLKAKAKV